MDRAAFEPKSSARKLATEASCRNSWNQWAVPTFRMNRSLTGMYLYMYIYRAVYLYEVSNIIATAGIWDHDAGSC